MPHIIVKLIPGRNEEQKKELTDKIVQAVREKVNAGESSISVSFEEVPSEKWEDQVYKTDILGKVKTLYKKPGYKY
ncbi:4-oxalocrotonate tautomerase [Bacillus sp. OV166]|uniref:tautomerase family protein n=1 Tax=Bacillus sp. OV166 TaxID=1882763 RepID=UPI000A2AEC86|nr:tautomerase family protein [Bacillus sp. OV166]SMQ81598.1 4-oxalocrotonate tautomerase [Bacillus sp. OV166]